MTVSIVLVNWRGWPDTLLCLQSLFRLRGDFRVIVCDNASGDDSVAMLRAWANGTLAAWVAPGHAARTLAVPGPEGGVALIEHAPGEPTGPPSDTRLVLLHTGGNLGFAGGCNAGMRYAISRGDSTAIWLLNNDTVVEPGALEALLAEVGGHGQEALVSSHIFRMTASRRVWFEGGEFRPSTGAGHHVSLARFASSRHPYLSGCSLLIPCAVWERIGLLDESFFMYGEDVDYSMRALAAGIPLRIATASIVLHAEAASSGHASASGYRNLVASGLRVLRRHFAVWYVVPAVAYHVAKVAFLWIVKRRPRAALRAYVGGIAEGLRR